MQLTTHSKNYTISNKLMTVLNKKLNNFQRYFDESATCVIACSRTGKTEKLEITMTQKGRMFRAEAVSSNMFANIDLALLKLERQIIKNKEKLKSVLRKEGVEDKKYAFYTKAPKFVAAEVIKQKTFAVEPLSAEEAELALETIDHSFFVYANKTNGKVSVMYRRADGNLGIIEISNSTVI